jgi:hypothetical protein
MLVEYFLLEVALLLEIRKQTTSKEGWNDFVLPRFKTKHNLSSNVLCHKRFQYFSN